MTSSTAGRRRSAADSGAADPDLDVATATLLLARLPELATRTVRAITDDVPAYEGAFAGQLGTTITSAVELALGGFLRLIGEPAPNLSIDRRSRTPALDGAYNLGRGEARNGRSMDALLAAYRVGAREAWREFSRTALETGVNAVGMARFAELVFDYIDGLSAASAAGHADELANTGRVRERHLNRLALGLISGESAGRLSERADRAGWTPPATFSAVILPGGQALRAMAALGGRTLRVDDELPDLDESEQADTSVLLVAEATGKQRPALLRSLVNQNAYVGPPKPWLQARDSYLRALRARRLGLPTDQGVCDTEDHLPTLVVAADISALADLRAKVLAPLDDLRPASASRLTETLRAWLLHQGRREDIAAALHIHPQTVRYRITQLREHFGEQLDQPETVAALTVALLAAPATFEPATDAMSDHPPDV